MYTNSLFGTTMPRHNRNRRQEGYKTNPISINATAVEPRVER